MRRETVRDDSRCIRWFLAVTWVAVAGMVSQPVEASGPCSIREFDADGDGTIDDVVLENAWHRITFQPQVGGTVKSWVFKPLAKELTSSSGQRAMFSDEVAEASAPQQRVPLRQPYVYEIVASGPEAAELTLHAALPPLPSQPQATSLEVRRTYTVTADSPLVEVRLEVRNAAAEPLPFAAMAVHWAWVEGETSSYFCPSEMGVLVDVDEVTGLPPSRASGSQMPPAAWTGFISHSSRLGLAFVLEERHLDAIENWISSRESSAIQWAYLEQDIPAGGSWSTRYVAYPLLGLDALDVATKVVAAGVTLAAEAGIGGPHPDTSTVGAAIPVTIAVTGPQPVDATVDVSVRRLSKENSEASLGSQPVSIRPLEVDRVQLSYTPQTPGTHVLDVTVRTAAGVVARFEKPLIVGDSDAIYLAPKGVAEKIGRPRIGQFMIDPPLPEYCFRFDRSWQTPHVPWGRPHHGGTVPMLFVSRDNYTVSHLREIWERGDFQCDLAIVAKSAGGRPYPYRRGLLGDLSQTLAAGKHEVVFFAGQKWQQGFTAALRRQIFTRIRQGLGAVILADPRVTPDDPDGGDLAAFLAEGTPLDAVTLTAGLPFKPPAVGLWEIGKGRVVVIQGDEGYYESVHATGSLGDWQPKGFSSSFPAWEYGYGLFVKAAYWAARRESPVVVQALTATPEGIDLTVENTSQKPLTAVVSTRVLDRFHEEQLVTETRIDLSAGPKTVRLPIAGGLTQGLHVADVILRDPAGASLGWASTAFEPPAAVSVELRMDRVASGYRPGDPIVAVATVRKQQPGKLPVTLSFTAVDAYGRLAFRNARDVTLEASETQVEIPLDGLRRVTVLHDLDVTVSDDASELCRDRHTFYVFHDRQPVYDDFKIGIYGTLNHNPLHAQSTSRTLRSLGVDEIYTYGSGAASREIAYRNSFFLIARQTKEADLRPRSGPGGTTIDTDTLVVTPPLTDPDTFARMEEAMRRHVRAATNTAGIDLYVLGDEWAWNAEFDRHPDTLARFRDWLRSRYASLGAVNAQWGTRYTRWDEVIPVRGDVLAASGKLDNLSAWYDFRHYMSTVWTEYVRRPFEAARAENPRAEVGFEGNYQTSVGVGSDVWSYLPYTRVTGRYNSMLEEWSRSVEPRVIHGQYGGYGLDTATPTSRFFPWRSLLHGGHWCFYYMLWDQAQPYQMILDFDGSPHGAYPVLAREEWADIKGGIGKLFMETQFVDDGIALPYDLASIYCGDLLGVDHRGDLFRHKSVVQELGFQHSTLSMEQIAAGELEQRGYRILLLPATICLSDEAAAAVRRFVVKGGTVVADAAAGVRDEHGRRREQAALDDLFGIDRSRTAGEPRRQQVEFLAAAPPSLAGRKARLKPLEMGLTAVGGTPLGRYEDGTAALVVNQVGKGRAILTNIDIEGYASSAAGGAAGEVVMEAAGAAEFVRVVRDLYSGVLSMAGLARRVTVSDGGEVILGGETFYSSDSTNTPLYVGTLIDSPAARQVEVRFPQRAYLYDVRDGISHGFTDRFIDEFRPGRAQVYAALPYRVAGLDAAVELPAGVSFAAGADVKLEATLRAEGGQPGLHIFRVEVFQPDGSLAEAYTANHRAIDGRLSHVIPLDLAPPPGTWKVVVTDVASRSQAIVPFTVSTPDQ